MGGFFGHSAPAEQGLGGGFFGRLITAPKVGGWTARTVPTMATGFNTNPAAANGIALIVDSNGAVWGSTDGGVTWLDTGTHLPSVTQIVASGSTLLLFAFNSVWRTIDGSTFSGPHALNFTGLNGVATAAGDGAGNWVVGSSGSRNTSISHDDGLTWTQHVIAGAGNWVVSLIWDGLQWVGILSTAFGDIGVSADGITWSFTPIQPNGSVFFNNTLGLQNGTYIGVVFNFTNNSVRTSATAVGLCTAADTDTGLPGSSGLQNVLVGNGKYWVFDNAGNTAGSLDGVNWAQVPLNFLPGDNPNSLFQAYDAVNHHFIAAGVFFTSLSTHNDTDLS